MITLDTSAVFTLVNRKDPDHERVKDAFLADPGPHLVPVPILSEIGYVLERRLGAKLVTAFLNDLISGSFAIDCGEKDLTRVRDLITRYGSLPLDLADAAVIACAERNGGGVLTLDVRHFGVVAREGGIRILPT